MAPVSVSPASNQTTPRTFCACSGAGHARQGQTSNRGVPLPKRSSCGPLAALSFPELTSTVEKEVVAPAFLPEDQANAYASQPEEFDYEVDKIEGAVPRGLVGTYFKNGPGIFERGDQKFNHMLDGDGYVLAFSISDTGSVRFKSKFVRTAAFVEETEKQEVVYRTIFGTQRPGGVLRNIFRIVFKNPANTNIVHWGGRLLALFEAGTPYEVDPKTLDTLGHPTDIDDEFIVPGSSQTTTFNDEVDARMDVGKAVTAHPKVVESTDGTGERLAIWNWQSCMGKESLDKVYQINEYDRNWNKMAETSFIMEDCLFLPHEFGVSASSYIFFQNAIAMNFAPFVLGLKGTAECMWLEKAPLKIHVIPREGGDPLVAEIDPIFPLHIANTFDDGDETVIWSDGWSQQAVMRKSENKEGLLGSWTDVLNGDLSGVPATFLWEHRVNRKTGQVVRRQLYSNNLQFPSVHPDYYGKDCRYIYFCSSPGEGVDPEHLNPLQGISKLDLKTGAAQTWSAGDHGLVEEPVFVPSIDNEDGNEDNGHLLAMVFDGVSKRSSLVILDARNLEAGPVARIWLQHHVPLGLHGNFVPAIFD